MREEENKSQFRRNDSLAFFRFYPVPKSSFLDGAWYMDCYKNEYAHTHIYTENEPDLVYTHTYVEMAGKIYVQIEKERTKNWRICICEPASVQNECSHRWLLASSFCQKKRGDTRTNGPMMIIYDWRRTENRLDPFVALANMTGNLNILLRGSA